MLGTQCDATVLACHWLAYQWLDQSQEAKLSRASLKLLQLTDTNLHDFRNKFNLVEEVGMVPEYQNYNTEWSLQGEVSD